MAIIKQKTNNQGVNYEYWVASPEVNPIDKTTFISVIGFVNKELREAGKFPVEKVFIGVKEGVYLTGVEIYSFVKESKLDESGTETNWFADSVDA